MESLTIHFNEQLEEADEAKRAEKQKKAEEHRIQQKVAAAVSDQKVGGNAKPYMAFPACAPSDSSLVL